MKESDYKWILDQAIFGFLHCKIIFDDTGRYSEFEFLEINPAFENLTTIRRQDIFDKKGSDNSPDILKFKRVMSEKCHLAIDTGEAETEYYSNTLNRWYKVQVLCTEKKYFSIIFFDVTKEKEDNTNLLKSKEELENSRAELKAIYEHTPVMMCLIDKNRRLLYANPALAFFSGTNENDLINGRACGVFGCINALDDPKGCGFGVKCKGCKLLSAIEDTFKTGNPHKDIEYEMTKKNTSQTFYLSSSTALIKSENPDNLLLLCMHDITARKQAEIDLNKKNKELQKINATKDKFFSIISHDLKSPFHSIVGFSDLLLEQVKEKSLEGTQRYAEIIQKSANRAINLLVNLTDWSLSQSNRKGFNPANFYVDELADEIILLFSESALQKSIKIVNKIPVKFPLKADREMISTVLRNLVSNALKFSFTGGEVIIETNQHDNELWISVKDSGVGIPPDAIEKLFRIDVNYSTQGTQNEVGTGLGLILCKEFVEKHHGVIRVESELGKGAVFSFSIPMKD